MFQLLSPHFIQNGLGLTETIQSNVRAGEINIIDHIVGSSFSASRYPDMAFSYWPGIHRNMPTFGK